MAEIMQSTDWRFTSPQEGEVDSVEQKQGTLSELDDALLDPGEKAQLVSRGAVPQDVADRSGRMVPRVTNSSSPYYDSTFVLDSYQGAWVTNLHRHPTPAHVPAADTLDPGVDLITSGGTYRLTGRKDSVQQITISRVANADLADQAKKLTPGFKVKTSGGTVSCDGAGTIEVKQVALADKATRLVTGVKIKTLDNDGVPQVNDGTTTTEIAYVKRAKRSDASDLADLATQAKKLTPGFKVKTVEGTQQCDGTGTITINRVAQAAKADRATYADEAGHAATAGRLNPGFKINGITVTGATDIDISGIKSKKSEWADAAGVAKALNPGFTIKTAGGDILCNGMGAVEIKRVAEAVKSDETDYAKNANYAFQAFKFQSISRPGQPASTSMINGYPFFGESGEDSGAIKKGSFKGRGTSDGLWLTQRDIPGCAHIYYGTVEPSQYRWPAMDGGGPFEGDIYIMYGQV